MKFITDNIERWVTGIALLATTIMIGLIDNYFVMWLYLGFFYFKGFDEAIKLFGIQRKSPYTYAIIIWLVAYFYPNPDDLFFIMAIFFGSKLAYTQEHIKKKLLIPFLYPVSGFLFMLVLYRDFGINFMLWLLIIVAITDTAAYFVGKSIGKTPFSPTSPNKTLEGVIGGITFAMVAGAITGYFMELVPSFFDALIISFLTATASIFGDLFESYIKREAGVKDSGTLLPGHGGVLDRLDGYLFGSIIMLIALRAFL
ncbi:MAG: Phosphatidate cytidylyltransferase (EC [uncultured Sulfurovum sp.]|uniref:Phosphatidate cytidylyltransferase n=1 Tax=uncultured Sulfurovum sp. TaxID=269237 RepID=A0A6S6T4H6_9BACT|nr:MAG: Phosphatidate cytidylyltransferase (EC [uncultured Sulfurovum sp.]